MGVNTDPSTIVAKPVIIARNTAGESTVFSTSADGETR
jgi:hypothetical protein